MTDIHLPLPHNRSRWLRTTAAAALCLAAALSVAQFATNASFAAPTASDIATLVPKPGLIAPDTQHAGFSAMVKAVKPAVVSVRVEVEGPAVSPAGLSDPSLDGPLGELFKRFQQQQGAAPDPAPRQKGTALGSGFFISSDGFVVTNNHVVENGKSFTIILDDGKEHAATLIGRDPKTDLAVLKAADIKDAPHVGFAKQRPEIGDWVIAVGNPFGLGGSVSAGIVSAEGRDIGSGPYDDFIQIDASVNKGNSGGPSFNAAGEVIGVNTAIFSPSGGSVGIGFAIPASTVENVVDRLIADGHITRGWLGIAMQAVTPELADGLGLAKAEGALVATPQPDGPAAKAGIKSGDVILTLDGKTVLDTKDLAKRVADYAPGATLHLGIDRHGTQKAIDVKIGTQPQTDVASAGADQAAPSGLPKLGLSLVPDPSGQGVRVSTVAEGSVAAEQGIKPGDVIVEVDGTQVASVEDVKNALKTVTASGKKNALILLQSGDATRFIGLPLNQG
jgi:serine protease Do